MAIPQIDRRLLFADTYPARGLARFHRMKNPASLVICCGPRRLIACLLVLAWGSPATLCKAGDTSKKERESIGYVLDSTGEWTQDGIKFSHKRGDPVYAGGVISLDPSYKEAHTRGAAITIILFNGKREERSFEQKANFAKAIELPTSLGEQSSPIERLLRAVGGLFSRHPEKYLITTVRSAVLLELSEAVVELDGDKLDLAPVFKGTPAGNYLVRLRVVNTGTPSERNATSKPFAFNWKAESKQRVAMPGLQPGLWRISLLQPNSEQPLGVDAWVLVSTPERYKTVAASFDQIVALTSKWNERASKDELRSFLRTALDALAQ